MNPTQEEIDQFVNDVTNSGIYYGVAFYDDREWFYDGPYGLTECKAIRDEKIENNQTAIIIRERFKIDVIK